MKPIERIEETSLLYEISKALNEHLDLKRSLYKVLDILSSAMNMVRGTITLLDPLRNEINIEVAHGISRSAIERVRYKLGEGITGRVIETGKAVAIPHISDEPRFLDRTASRKKKEDRDLSFFCVPIKKGAQVIGALSVDRPYEASYSLDNGRHLLSVIATMVASHVIKLETIRVEHERLRDENRRLQTELKGKYTISNIIGSSNRMREVYQMVSQVSRSNATVLIRGESGTGKELVANSIHYNSQRAANPFIKLNCAAQPSNLIESELFGHEKGAFTGATARRAGVFERADGGTVFLDEVGELPAGAQTRLLRVLQTRRFERVGGSETITGDVRIVAATNRDLEKDIVAARFRSDLFYRLNVFPIHMPPLRERGKADIMLLADGFAERFGKAMAKPITRIDTPAIDMLTAYHWPGNVRELENVIERAVVMAESDVIHGHHLPPSLQMNRYVAKPPGSEEGSFLTQVANFEIGLITEALKDTSGNQTQAAKRLGMTKRIMQYKIKLYGIDVDRLK